MTRRTEIQLEWVRAVVLPVAAFLDSDRACQLWKTDTFNGVFSLVRRETAELLHGGVQPETVEAFIHGVVTVNELFTKSSELPEWTPFVARCWVQSVKQRGKVLSELDYLPEGDFDREAYFAGSAWPMMVRALSTPMYHYAIQLLEFFLKYAPDASETVSAVTTSGAFSSVPTSRSSPTTRSTPLTSGTHQAPTIPQMTVATSDHKVHAHKAFMPARRPPGARTDASSTQYSPERTEQSSGTAFDHAPDTDPQMDPKATIRSRIGLFKKE